VRKKVWIGFLVSAVFLYLAVRGVHPREVWTAMTGARFLWLVPGSTLTIVAFMIRAWRWRYLMEPVRPIGFGASFSATMIGFMANNVLPARAGEVVRAVALGRRERISKSSVFATIVMERLFDLFTILLILGAVFLVFPFPALVLRAGITVLIISVGILLALVLLHFQSHNLRAAIEPAFQRLPGRIGGMFTRFMQAFIDGLGILRRGRHIAIVALLSALMWLVTILGIVCVLLAMSQQMPYLENTLKAALALLVAVSLAIMVPSTPGYIGPVQYVCKEILALFQVTQEAALGFSFLYQASQFIPITAVGIYYLWKENLSLADLSRGDAEAPAERPSARTGEREQG
jgi:uncharacterized protein (TIRG00374 family)